MVNVPEGSNFFYRKVRERERDGGRSENFGKILKKSIGDREREWGWKKLEPTLPFALKHVGGRSENNPKWHLFVTCSSISMLRQTICRS